jgi:branched-chain amino acid transport system substrate-binding protein
MPGRHLRGAAMLVAVSVAAVGCSSGSDKSSSSDSDSGKTGVVEIGVNDSLTGALTIYGTPPAAAVDMAAQNINKAGGFKVGDTTYTLKVTTLDNRSVAATAVANQTQLTQDNGIKFVFGPSVSGLADQASAISVASGTMMLSPAGSLQASGALANAAMPYLFGTQVPIQSIAAAEAATVMKRFGGKTVGMLSQDDSTASSNVPTVKAAFVKAGLTVLDERFPTTTTDLTPIIQKMKSQGMDMFFFWLPATRAAEAVKDMLQVDPNVKGIMVPGVDPTFATKDALGKPLPVPFANVVGYPSIAEPPNATVAKFGTDLAAASKGISPATAPFAFWSYDFVTMLTQAMQKAGTVKDVAAISAALKKIEYTGVVGKVCFQGSARQALYPVYENYVVDGKITTTAVPSPLQCGQ